MQSSKEHQGEIRKPPSVINAKKERKTTEWERRNLFNKLKRCQGNILCKDGHTKDRNGMDLTEAEDIRRGIKNTQKNNPKKIFMTQITMMV